MYNFSHLFPDFSLENHVDLKEVSDKANEHGTEEHLLTFTRN